MFRKFSIAPLVLVGLLGLLFLSTATTRAGANA